MRVMIALYFLTLAVNIQASYFTQLGLKPNPSDAGENTLELMLSDDKGNPVDDARIDLLIYMPAMGSMARMEEKAKIVPKGKGKYLAEFNLAMGGTWEITLTVDKDQIQEKFAYSLTTGIPGLNDKNSGKRTKTSDGSQPTNLLPIGPDRLQRIGVRFVEAKAIPMERKLRAVGVVEADNTKRSELTLRFAGYVEKQFKGQIGDYVAKDTPLFSLYSPDLITAQNEFLLAHGSTAGDHSLHTSTAERLRNYGLSPKEIDKLKSSRKAERTRTILAPQAGTILAVDVREGSSFSPGQVLYAIGDLTKNYIIARVFQRDVQDLKVGQPVMISIPGEDGTTYSGKIDLIYPSINEGEGTANVRIIAGEVIPDLKTGSYADLHFQIDLGKRLAIPASSILYSGAHKYVFIDQGDGALEPKEIISGKSAEDWVEVKSGVKEGERVAASGTFLLSSEAQLHSALPKWTIAEKPAAESKKHDEESADGKWTCPMHPDVMLDKPGKCPICGMTLEPAKAAMSPKDSAPNSMPMKMDSKH